MQRNVISVRGPRDGKQPIYSEIRIGLRILTAGEEARRIFLGPAASRSDSFLKFECSLPCSVCSNCRYVLVRAAGRFSRAAATKLQGSPLDVSSGNTHARGFPCSMCLQSLLSACRHRAGGLRALRTLQQFCARIPRSAARDRAARTVHAASCPRPATR
jgi:hypothetical protein